MLPGLIFALFISESTIPLEWKIEMVQCLSHCVNDDGGWGLHHGGTTTVFATTLYYIVLRILGMEPSHPLAVRARERLLALGESIVILEHENENFTIVCAEAIDTP